MEKRHKEGGPAFSALATILGVTKNQVVGYARRHFIQYTGQVICRYKGKKHLEPKLPRKSPVKVKKVEDPSVPKSLKIAVTPVDAGECSYVFGDPNTNGWSYCGHKIKESSSYCEYHHKLTHIPVSKRDQRYSRQNQRRWTIPI